MKITMLLLLLSGCATSGYHLRPAMGCAQQVCEYGSGFECYCWDPTQCFATEYECTENLKASIKETNTELFDQMVKTGEADTI
jgi:hypothetical protein